MVSANDDAKFKLHAKFAKYFLYLHNVKLIFWLIPDHWSGSQYKIVLKRF